MDKEIYKKIIEKKEFSQLPKKDIEKVFLRFEKREVSEEEKIRLARDLLRKIYFAFGSRKLLNKKIVDKKTPEEILQKHISTRERFKFYDEVYGKLFQNLKEEKVCVIDLGAGINGFSFNFLKKYLDNFYYFGVEAVGQLVDLMNYYFKNRGIENAGAISESLFNLEKIKKLILQVKEKKVVFLFKTLDSLEMLERDYSKKLLEEIFPLVDFIVVSFATKSLISKKAFKVKRYWFENFVKTKNWNVSSFETEFEKYFILSR